MSNPYIGKMNEHGQVDVVRRTEAHLPHVYVSWWDGGMYRQACIPASGAEQYRPTAEMRSVTPAKWID